MIMHLKNEEETRDAIERWRSGSSAVQVGNLRKALESMELDQMHYEQKENAQGVVRCGACLLILRQRIAELESA